jgi:hypothetical protein
MQGDVARIMLSCFVLFCFVLWMVVVVVAKPFHDDRVEGSQGLPAKQKFLIGPR